MRIGALIALVLSLVSAFASVAAAAPQVYAVAIRETIDPGLAAIVRSAVQQAEADQAAALVLVINTPGGRVDSAVQIRDAVLGAKVPTVAYVERAVSAGALIALAAEKLYMVPGSQIGDAEPIPYSDKAVAYVTGEFESVAQARKRDPGIAAAMVDKRRNQQGAVPLTLTGKQALERGIADGVVSDLDEALAAAGVDGPFSWYEPDLSQRAARFLTSPWVAALLLVVGVAAAAIEFAKPGVTLPGLVATVALGTFFGSHYLIGTAGWLEIGLVILGLFLLVVEIFVPGFGVFGLAGILSVLGGVFLSAPTEQLAVRYAVITLIGSTVVGGVLVYQFSRRGLGSWLTLATRLDTRYGYVPARTALEELRGSTGTALTPLRPAGTAQFGDRRVDVVTEGEFVQVNTEVTVVAVDGTRVVVRAGSQGGPDSE